MRQNSDMDVGQTQNTFALSAQQLADRLGVSLRHVRRMDSAQMLPRPFRLGRSVRWDFNEVRSWIKAGAPDRQEWEQIRQRRNGRSN